MPWDPLNAWPAGRRWLWAALAALICIVNGPQFVQSLRPRSDQWADFFQLWASARNVLSGFPVYENHKSMVERYLGYQPGPNERMVIQHSSQTPTAVLLALPFAGLSYPHATLVWNFLSLTALAGSLWLVADQLRIKLSIWSVFPLLALLLICHPFRQQMSHGQLNLVLLALVTGTWVLDRSGRPYWAGALLGAATAIKLFPGFFFLYFLLRGQWKVVVAGVAAFATLIALTVALVGLHTYRNYAGLCSDRDGNAIVVADHLGPLPRSAPVAAGIRLVNTSTV